jgi:hypothetical protein
MDNAKFTDYCMNSPATRRDFKERDEENLMESPPPSTSMYLYYVEKRKQCSGRKDETDARYLAN